MSYAEFLIEKYRSKGLLLDSNLLLLYLIGAVDPALVGDGRYNKLSDFTRTQIVILKRLTFLFRHLVTTAHVLTEVSNLIGTMHDAGKLRVFSSFADTLEVVREQDVSSYRAARRTEFYYLGLTDSILAELAGEFLVVSNDARMVDVLRQSGFETLKWVEVLGLTAD